MKRGKRYKKAFEMIEEDQYYSLEDAVGVIVQLPQTKFDESLDINFCLGVDPKHADQLVRGQVTLPHGTGKKICVLVFAQGDKAKEAQAEGADYVGFKDLVEKIKGGWLEFDIAVASPDTMSEVGKLGKVLGPKGLMPSPKAGTVTPQVGKAVKEIKAGRIEFRVDKGGTLHMAIGKRSFSKEALFENTKTAIEAIVKARPPAAKGQYIKSATLSTSMGPGVKLDVKPFLD